MHRHTHTHTATATHTQTYRQTRPCSFLRPESGQPNQSKQSCRLTDTYHGYHSCAPEGTKWLPGIKGSKKTCAGAPHQPSLVMPTSRQRLCRFSGPYISSCAAAGPATRRHAEERLGSPASPALAAVRVTRIKSESAVADCTVPRHPARLNQSSAACCRRDTVDAYPSHPQRAVDATL